MLFEKDIEPRCAYCKRGSLLGEDQVMCLKRGIMSAAGSCRAFRYAPPSLCIRTFRSCGMRTSYCEFQEKTPVGMIPTGVFICCRP